MIPDVLVPAGYVPLRFLDIEQELERWAKQGAAFTQLGDGDELYRLPPKLVEAIVDGTLRTPGYDLDTGDLLWIPKEAWRLGYQRGTLKNCASQIDAAMSEGEPIITEHDTGRWLYPLLRLCDLADWVGASFRPEPPKKSPEELRVVSAETAAASVSPPDRGGRRKRDDWDAFWIEVCHWVSLNIDKEGFQPEDRSRLQEYMREWTATNPPKGREAMNPGTVRGRLKQLEDRFKRPLTSSAPR